jgi:hypothetical protein
MMQCDGKGYRKMQLICNDMRKIKDLVKTAKTSVVLVKLLGLQQLQNEKQQAGTLESGCALMVF